MLGDLYIFEACGSASSPAATSLCVPKLDSAILVMKAAQNRSGHNRADALNRPMNGSIQVQSPMGPRAVVVGSILSKNPPQVRFTERDQMVDTFPPDRADQPFRMPIPPRRPGRDRSVPNIRDSEKACEALNGMLEEQTELLKQLWKTQQEAALRQTTSH